MLNNSSFTIDRWRSPVFKLDCILYAVTYSLTWHICTEQQQCMTILIFASIVASIKPYTRSFFEYSINNNRSSDSINRASLYPNSSDHDAFSYFRMQSLHVL